MPGDIDPRPELHAELLAELKSLRALTERQLDILAAMLETQQQIRDELVRALLA